MRLGVAIMAGGEGQRLSSLGVPKALAPLSGATLLDHQLHLTAALRPSITVVLLHHQADAIAAHLGDRGVPVVEPAPLGTAGGLALLPEGPDVWLVINVDHISDVSLPELIAGWSPPCTAVLSEVAVPVDEGVVELSEGRLVGWRERPVLRLPVTTGLYVFQAAALREILTGARIDMPDLIAALMPAGVTAWRHPGTWIDAGTLERLTTAREWLSG
ncbi:MAG: NTP transferase domain-containing protein [Myxococcota bacterium]|nr:NTP transferase domain-containing protein [Myxococcota bacterium]